MLLVVVNSINITNFQNSCRKARKSKTTVEVSHSSQFFISFIDKMF